MSAVAMALISVVTAVVGHAALLRLLATRFVLLTLVCFVVATPLVLGVISLAGGGLIAPLDWAIAALLAVSLGLPYVQLFVGIANDTPTLALINAVADFGDRGMPVEEIATFVAQHPFVSSRLEAMVQSGVLTLEGENWVLRDRVGPVLRLCEAYRALCARQTAAG